MTGKYFIHQGVLKPAAEALVPLDDINYAYGYGVYETLKLRKGLVYFVHDHVGRLYHSAGIIGICIPFSKNDVASWILQLCRKNEAADANIKILCIGGNKPGAADIYIFLVNPLFPDRRLYSRGASVILEEGERHFPQAKSLSMLISTMAYRKAVAADCYDALLVNRNGSITEGTRTNIFYLKDGGVWTPPKAEVLEGVTKHKLCECLAGNGISVKSRDIKAVEIATLDGLFLTSTSSKIIPVRLIDKTEIPIPERIRELMRLFDAFLDNYANQNGIF